MIEIDSGDVMHMRDTSFSELLDEINSKARQTRMSVALSLTALAIGAVAALATGGPGLLICAVALPAGAIGSWLDSYRRTTVLYYDLEGDAETAYGRLTEGYDGLNGCAAKWHIEAGGAIQSLTAWKRNAGASHLVNRKSTTLAYTLPSVIKSNVTPPALHVGRQVMFFMPDIVLVQDGSRVGAVSYTDLNVRWQESMFIETDRVPSDARIVDHTWKHPNKSGGPDRRFRDNRQIPICLYETMHLTSNSGVNELVEFSRTGVVAAFVDGCRMLAALPRERKATVALPPAPANGAVDVPPVNATERKGSFLKGALLTVLALMVGIPAFAIFFGPRHKEADAGLPPNLVAETSETLAAGEKDGALPEKIKIEPTPQVPTVNKTEMVQSGSSTSDKAEPTAIRYTKTDANLREGPGTKFAVINVVPKGGRVSVMETKGGWSRVQVDVKTSGWMANSTIVGN
ncbi:MULTISPECIES: SH3 domain-containing protein [unclassified Agrobacterium]